MLLVNVRELSRYKLKHNFGSGVSLTFVFMVVYLCINLVGKLASTILSTAMPNLYAIKDINKNDVFVILLTLLLSFLLLMPLSLNIKSWYQSINGKYTPIAAAFSYFSSFKKYMSVLYFCLVRFFTLLLTFLIPLIPGILLFYVLKIGFLSSTNLGSAFGALVVITVILLFMGFIFAVNYAIGFFYADYIYIKDINNNPFKALSYSRKLAKKNRNSLLRIIVAVIPYFLLCIFLVTIPFIFPKIRTFFAIHADEVLIEN